MTAAIVRPGAERSMLAFVNAAIDELQRSLGLSDSEFFCECGSNVCNERIPLTSAEYAILLEASEPVLVEAHAHRRAGASLEPVGRKHVPGRRSLTEAGRGPQSEIKT